MLRVCAPFGHTFSNYISKILILVLSKNWLLMGYGKWQRAGWKFMTAYEPFWYSTPAQYMHLSLCVAYVPRSTPLSLTKVKNLTRTRWPLSILLRVINHFPGSLQRSFGLRDLGLLNTNLEQDFSRLSHISAYLLLFCYAEQPHCAEPGIRADWCMDSVLYHVPDHLPRVRRLGFGSFVRHVEHGSGHGQCCLSHD